MKEPNETCPDIDIIIKELDSTSDELGNIVNITNSISNIVSNMYSDMEILRQANEELRSYGNYWRDEYKNLEREYSMCESLN